MNLINANEARELLNSATNDLRQEAITLLDNRIRAAIKLGASECYIGGKYPMLCTALVVALEAGYVASLADNQRDGPTLRVEWKK